jgi:hypothetical protein
MYENEANGKQMEAGIISFKNLKTGFLPFSFKEGKEENTRIDSTILNDYSEQMVLLLNEILDDKKPFEEKMIK